MLTKLQSAEANLQYAALDLAWAKGDDIDRAYELLDEVRSIVREARLAEHEREAEAAASLTTLRPLMADLDSQERTPCQETSTL